MAEQPQDTPPSQQPPKQEQNVRVPLKEMTVYQADDGRRIEVFKLVDTVSWDTRDPNTNETPEFSDSEYVYIGVLHIYTNEGTREIKFQISDVDNIQQAFDKYYNLAEQTLQKIREQIQKAQAENDRIVKAPANVLQELDDSGGDSDGGIVIP
jgi:hypothetical protein